MDQQILMQAQYVQKQIEELEEHLDIIEKELVDLSSYDTSLDHLQKSTEKKIVASIGKGIHLKANIENKDLYVEVGAGVVVKKTIPETQSVIKNQIARLIDAKKHVEGKLEIYHNTIQTMIADIQKAQEEQNPN